MAKSPKHVHLIGICGTGMGTFAGLLKAAGYEVRGSDANVYPPMSDSLKEWGIPVLSGYASENLEPTPDLVIVGNAIRKSNPEAARARTENLPSTSMAKALGDLFLKGRHSIVVSGTHGKTTTTSLMAWILTHSHRDPSMFVGGIPENFQAGFRLGKGDHFVVEGDEYDSAYFDKVPKFLHYEPRTLILTSLEFDHADIYENVEEIEAEFSKLIALVPPGGRILACAHEARIRDRLKTTKARVETYSAAGDADATWHAQNLVFSERGSEFSVFHEGIKLGRFALGLGGRHNVENAVAAIALGAGLGLSVHELKEAVRSFKGVRRRQTIRSEARGIRIIDDFAHHPTAVKQTVEAIRKRYPAGRLFAVFEPRTATSSRRFFQSAYAGAFHGADETIIAPVGRSEIPPEARLDTEQLAKTITNKDGHRARAARTIDQIVELLVHEAQTGDTILLMSNGGFGDIHRKLEDAFSSTPPPT